MTNTPGVCPPTNHRRWRYNQGIDIGIDGERLAGDSSPPPIATVLQGVADRVVTAETVEMADYWSRR
jgi:hypothetical protein